jgi:beta-glucoside operon transcriptional antiterminator
MQIIKKINTSAALALDTAGREIVVLGKGIGFPQVPYELEDLSKVERTFYDVDPKYIGMVAELPQELLLICADAAERAEEELNCQLNPNLPFTLADHLQFAHQRLKNGIDLTTPIAYDIRNLYPREYALGKEVLSTLREQTGIVLPEHEAISVAMHLINAESESGDIHSLMRMMQIINEVDKMIEEKLQVSIDKESFHYNRFVMHMRYLIQRLETGKPCEEQMGDIARTMKREYPSIYVCAASVSDYFYATWGWKCTEDELLYLMIHIQRVTSK